MAPQPRVGWLDTKAEEAEGWPPPAAPGPPANKGHLDDGPGCRARSGQHVLPQDVPGRARPKHPGGIDIELLAARFSVRARDNSGKCWKTSRWPTRDLCRWVSPMPSAPVDGDREHDGRERQEGVDDSG